MAKTAQQMLDNWKSGMSGAASKYKAGISNVTVNPMALAAEAEDAYLSGIQNGLAKRKAKLMAADPNVWKNNALTVGAAALASGATKATPKMQKHYTAWAPIYAQASAASKALPKSDTLGRVAAAINVMKQAAGKPTI